MRRLISEIENVMPNLINSFIVLKVKPSIICKKGPTT